MDIDIYESIHRRGKFMSVPARTDPSQMSFPADLDQDYLGLVPFREDVPIEAARPMIAMDAADIIRQIDETGYALHRAEVRLTTR